MHVIATFNCARVRGNFLQAQEAPSRSALAITVAEGTTRATVLIPAGELRKLAIFALQRAEELGA